MQTTDGYISENTELGKEEHMLLTYDEEERQNNEINRENAKRVFSPKFIPFYPQLLDKGLTLTEAILFGFIDFYTSNGQGRFYFSNEQLSNILRCSETYASETVSSLISKGFIKVVHKMKAGGGRIRFIECNKPETTNFGNSELAKSENPSTISGNSEVHINKNKINNNNKNTISNDIVQSSSVPVGKKKRRIPQIDLLLEWLKDENGGDDLVGSRSEQRIFAKHIIGLVNRKNNPYTQEQVENAFQLMKKMRPAHTNSVKTVYFFIKEQCLKNSLRD